ncbi:endonuclease III [Acidaminobacter sp.]|uniref:endonuclease III n=1 Tax=Acidaminobacter sp. TaxID=1872102 RepID=UPI00137F7BB0|nr:endonuclease III [Acidaminobacter sp.]MDK9711961.1 endonuclease III [Acidaminobacter sp.]MZQ97659.1 endonuclease III [Acidaminobacter sp.]
MAKKKVPKPTKKEKAQMIELLLALYPDAAPELTFNSDYELLVAVILSAQCTDVRVNEVTNILFKRAGTPEAMTSLSLETLEDIIRPCGLFHTKAKNILTMSQTLTRNYDGKVPETMEQLMELPGVGRKTANVVVSNAFGVPAIAVDTHVFRVSARLGLASGQNVDKTEQELMKVMPREHWTKLHHCLILHGRRVCKARKPACETCGLNGLCPHGKQLLSEAIAL